MADNTSNNQNVPEASTDNNSTAPKLPPVKPSPLVQWGFKYHGVVLLVVCLLAAFGVYSLDEINKNEFPNFTIREGVLVAVAPGVSAEEMEERVMKPMEDFIFSYQEVNKAKTRSNAVNGMVMTFIELDNNVSDADAFWTKFNMGLPLLKDKLPSNVLATRLISNFGETSAILLTMQSKQKTYRELNGYMDKLKDELNDIPSVGTMTVYGMQNEQISVIIDPEKLSKYAVDEKTIAAMLFSQGFKTTGGNVKTPYYTSPIYVDKPVNSIREIEDLIILSLPTGPTVRLRDVADVKLEYPDPDSYITNNGDKCLLLSIEMKKGNNVVKMGEEVSTKLDEFKQTLPTDVTLFEITNQPKVVSASVWNFMQELLIAVVAVVIAIILLLPLRVALIAASTIPITIFVSLAFFYVMGFELNTVTLACLIVSLGMIVDNSVVIIDDYVELIGEGMDRKTATIRSASEFFKSIFSATLAISVTFFPFLFTLTGMFRDFLSEFPWAMLIILVGSFFMAELLVPFLQYALIKPSKAQQIQAQGGGKKKKHFSILSLLQSGYNGLIKGCFKAPWLTIIIALALTAGGIYLFMQRPMQMMPIAERNQFAVEIFLPTNTPVERSTQVADSLEAILSKDKRVVSIANFHGCSSPRFQTTYAPQVGGPNFAQFIVNTKSNQATEEVLHEYGPKYESFFPDAIIRFKQLSYSNAPYAVELKLTGSNLAELQSVSDTILSIMHHDPDLNIVRSSLDMPSMATLVKPDPIQMSRIGKTTTNIELDLALRYSGGVPVGTLWDGTHATDVVVRTTDADRAEASQLENGLIHSLAENSVPLGEIAQVMPSPQYGQISHLGGQKTIYLTAGVPFDTNAVDVTKALMKKVEKVKLPEGVTLSYGGEWENTMDVIPQIGGALAMAVVIIFFILLLHYKNVRLSIFLLLMVVFCLPGAGIGLWIEDISFSVTCTLGIISLMGILVRNVIIMIDYAEEIQITDGLSTKEAILESAQRRMRPIFLTSAAASMGVIPMVLGKSPLWMPMGAVIFWGTLITMVFILTIIPVLYWLTQNKKKKPQIQTQPDPTPQPQLQIESQPQ